VSAFLSELIEVEFVTINGKEFQRIRPEHFKEFVLVVAFF